MENKHAITHQFLNTVGRLSKEEQEWVSQCRRDSNQLGFCYQLTFVKIFNRFPQKEPFELIPEILDFASSQINVEAKNISTYQRRRQTFYEHQQRLLALLNIRKNMMKTLERWWSNSSQKRRCVLINYQFSLKEHAASLKKTKS